MSNKKHSTFYIVNTTVLLLSAFVILCGLRGSIQERLGYFQDFSILTVKFILKSFGTLFFSCAIIILAIKILKPVPENPSQKKKKIFFLLSGYFLYFIALSLLVLKKWATNRFPMDQPEVVYFTLTHIQGGGIDNKIFFESGKILFVCFIISTFFCFIELLYELKTQNYYLSVGRIKNISLNFLWFVFGLSMMLFSLIDLYKDLSIKDYREVILKYSKPPVESEFYASEYVVPEYEKIEFPKEKRNLIIILMESMESSFADNENGGILEKNLIPNLTGLANENINFSNTDKIGGGIDLSGTGWTIAAMTSKFAGLPFNLLGAENRNHTYFLPGAITLTDILDKNGYKQLFIFGSDKHFAGRDALLETHGNVEVHDIDWYKKNDMLANDYSVFWGFEDEKLFNFAKYELNNLGNSKNPFMFGLLTVDTHMPTGYQCEACPSSEDMPLKNSILCSDILVSSFIDWCKTQPWYDNTVIVVMGDHLFMATEDTSPFGNNDYLTAHRLKTELDGMDNTPRRWIDIFINSPLQDNENNFIKNRKFSSFDMFPTILASIGSKIEGDKLGFGVNLFSGEKTLCERFSEEYINSEIMARNKQYEYMEFIQE